jgi:hypothetical protein
MKNMHNLSSDFVVCLECQRLICSPDISDNLEVQVRAHQLRPGSHVDFPQYGKQGIPQKCMFIQYRRIHYFCSIWQDGDFWDADVTSCKLQQYFVSEEGECSLPPEMAEILSNPVATTALGGLVSYLRKLNLDAELVTTGRFGPLAGSSAAASRHMTLDAQALSDLHILDCGTSRAPGGTAVSLFQHLDHCKTGFGRRY